MQKTNETIETDEFEIQFGDGFLKIDGNGFKAQVEYETVDAEIEEMDPEESMFRTVHRLNFYSNGKNVLSVSRYMDHVVHLSIFTEMLNSRVSVSINEMIFSELWNRMT